MKRIKRTIICSFILSLALSSAFPAEKIDKYIFSAFSLGGALEYEDDNNDDRITLLKDDTDIEYSFKIAEWFHKLFE